MMRVVTGLSILALTSALVHAQEPTADILDDPTRLRSMMVMLQIGGQGITEEEILSRLTRPIRQFDRNDDGLDIADAALQTRIDSAAIRATNLTTLTQFDLNGDGTVTRAELDEAVAYPSLFIRQMGDVAELFDARDTNKDEQVTWEELTALDARQAERVQQAGVDQFLRSVALFEPEFGQRFTLDDARTLAPLIMSSVDEDGNGVATLAEMQRLLLAASQNAQALTNGAGDKEDECSLPSVSEEDTLVLFGNNSGTRQADVSLSGSSGDVTHVVDVVVEDGPDPLYIVLSSYNATLWRFSGAVERVSRVAPTSVRREDNSGIGLGGSGVTGIPAEKVSFLASWNCLMSFETVGGMEEAKVSSRLQQIAGRKPDVVGASGTTHTVSVPSMVTETDEGASHREPLPVIKVDPKDVVAAVDVIRWDILPGRAGIEQLLAAGNLVKLPDGSDGYKIVRTFDRFPTNLTGGAIPGFLLGTGVELPKGSMGWACVISEETGEVLNRKDSPQCR